MRRKFGRMNRSADFWKKDTCMHVIGVCCRNLKFGIPGDY